MNAADIKAEIAWLRERLSEASARIATLTGTCACCGWNKETEPESGQEPPIVKGALDAQAEAEKRVHTTAEWLRAHAFELYDQWKEEGCPATWADFLADAVLETTT